jgi:hypothetical protein
MGKVYRYREFLTELQDEFNRFEAEVATTAEDNGLTFTEVLNSLDQFEIADYEWLQYRIEQLKRWESVDLVFGAYRRAERLQA